MSLPAQLSFTDGTARLRVVLVVEDEDLVRGLAADFLREAGFSVIEAADAAEALCALASGDPIDAVFSDVQMPGPMDGLQLAAWVRQHRAVPVLLTSGSRETMREAGYAEEDGSFLPKPYALPEITRRLEALLDEKA
jgi:CheY-like chemotaxis protein